MTQEVHRYEERRRNNAERGGCGASRGRKEKKKRGRRIGHFGHVKVYVFISMLYLVYIAVSHVKE